MKTKQITVRVTEDNGKVHVRNFSTFKKAVEFLGDWDFESQWEARHESPEVMARIHAEAQK